MARNRTPADEVKRHERAHESVSAEIAELAQRLEDTRRDNVTRALRDCTIKRTHPGTPRGYTVALSSLDALADVGLNWADFADSLGNVDREALREAVTAAHDTHRAMFVHTALLNARDAARDAAAAA